MERCRPRRRRHAARVAFAVAVWVGLTGGTAASAEDAAAAIARGDAAWLRRAEGAREGRAAAAPIAAAVAAYEEALRAEPADLEAHWKLMRALWFQGEYAAADNAAEQRVFGRGKAVAESAMAVLARRVGAQKLHAERAVDRAAALRGVPEAAPLLLWSAANWGLWGDAYGKLAAARQGGGQQGARLGRDADRARPAVRERRRPPRARPPALGGATRAAGHRLGGPRPWHRRAGAGGEPGARRPRQPALPRRGIARLLDHRPAAKARALALLREVASSPAAPETVVEDAASSAAARRRLAAAE
jgi:hypothetical protein